MPSYAYQPVNEDGTCGGILQVRQSIADRPSMEHLESGQEIRSVDLQPRAYSRYQKAALGKHDSFRPGNP